MSFKSYPTCGVLLQQPKWKKRCILGDWSILHHNYGRVFNIYIYFLKCNKLGTFKIGNFIICKLFLNRANLKKNSNNVKPLLLLLLPSRLSRVWLCATPETAAHQAPPSLGFSRQENWSGLPFPSPMHERKSESEVALSDSMDCSLPGSSVHGIFQARVLEWVAIAFSGQASRPP